MAGDMRKRLEKRTAREAWFALLGLIIFWEVYCPPGALLSEGIDEMIVRWPVTTRFVVLLVALHLVNWLPARFDPLHQLAKSGGRS